MDFQEKYSKIGKRRFQPCPLCGEEQIIMMRGKTLDLEDGSYNTVGDRGYSFCNCRNIFYTKWSNIDKNIYDSKYIENHTIGNHEKEEKALEFSHQWKVAKEFVPNAKSFLNVGDYNDFVLDYLKIHNWSNMTLQCLDIAPRESRHRLIIGDFDTFETEEKFDVVWMSHVIEHLKDPKEALLKAKKMLNVGGILFVATPNTRHIDFSNPLEWCWHIEEHHTLWNMYDWIDFAEEVSGMKCVYKYSSNDVIDEKYSNGKEGAYWIKEQRTIFQKLA